MGRRVHLDEECCLGCEACVEICPEVFRMNEETEKSEVIKAEGGPEEQIQEAMDSCPAECIDWEE